MVESLQFSNIVEGTTPFLASASRDKSVRVWDLNNFSEVFTFVSSWH